jgi:hypothetical protein
MDWSTLAILPLIREIKASKLDPQRMREKAVLFGTV